MAAAARILVVDSDRELGDDLSTLLAGHGFEVRATSPGQPLDGFIPDVVVIDLRDGVIDAYLATQLGLAPRGTGPALRAADVVIDLAAHLVERAGVPVELTRTELALLVELMRRAGQVVSKSELLERLWGTTPVKGNVVEVHVSSLRRKLEEHGPRLIHTVRGVGYRV